MRKVAFIVSRALIAIAAFSLLAACGGGGSDDNNGGGGSDVSSEFKNDACNQVGLKIANGFSCSPGEDPAATSLVLLDILDTNGSIGACSGVVVDSQIVMTAGHCVQGGVAAILVSTPAGQQVAATSIAQHPGFRRSGGVLFDDYAFVFVNQPINSARASILLSRAPQVGEEVYVAGRGETSQGSGAVDNIFAGAAVIDNVTDAHIWISFEGNQSHPCGGDSGGPLLIKLGNGNLAVAGLVSQSDPSVDPDNICKVGDYTIYGNVQAQSVLDFITTFAPNTGVK
ncbi:MAG: trypsin-like serine protease [Bdellovibrionales bacterium]|nr:trypsin-like serine protease [Bdellovibrionales bacterium]